jgi:hypothetical protein
VASQGELIPGSYASWRYCITVECGIPLTAEFVARRIDVLSRSNGEETLQFRRLYGDEHWQRVLAWFRQSQNESAAPQ